MVALLHCVSKENSFDVIKIENYFLCAIKGSFNVISFHCLSLCAIGCYLAMSWC